MLNSKTLNSKTGCKTHHRLVHAKPAHLLTLSLGLTSIVTPLVLAEKTSGRLLEIEEVVVTAQKRTESLQDTPIAISAFSATRLEQIGAESAADIGAYTPNATITRSLGSAYNIRMNIRGNSTADPSLAIDPKVGIYLDGAYIARNAGSVFDVVDLERIEVLRGPQGTLWGKNTTGGALNMVTRKPSSEFNFEQQFSLGNDGYYRSKSTIDTVQFGNFSSKWSYVFKGTDGWASNTSDQGEEDLGSQTTEAFRVALRFDLTEDLSIDYAYDRTDGEAVPDPLQPAEVRAPTSGTRTTLFLPGYSPVSGNVFEQMAKDVDSNKRLDSFEFDHQGAEVVDIFGHNLTIAWSREMLELKSISAYRAYSSDFSEGQDLDGGAYFSADGTSLAAFHSSSTKSQHQWSQELQLVGNAFQDRLKYVVGLYYFEEAGREVNPWQAFTVYAQIVDDMGGVLFDGNMKFTEYGSFYKNRNKSEAVYSQLAYQITDDLEASVGLRYTQDDKDLVLLDVDPILDEDESVSESWDELTSSFTLAYSISEEINTYFKVAEGFAAGVYNPGTVDRNPQTTQATPTEAALVPSDPEQTRTYELGMKSQLWDKRLRLNIALFFNDNENLQITDFKDGVRQSFNSGESETSGIEVDFTALLSQSITLSGSYGYLDTDFKPEKGEVKRRQGTPRNTANLGLQYDFRGVSFGQLAVRFDVVHSDDDFFSSSDRRVKSDGYSLLNGRISLSEVKVGKGLFRTALWGKNLTDKKYIVHGANFGFFTGYTWGTPCSVGADVAWEF